MEENITPVHHHRHRKTKQERFKEHTLPYLILLAALILVISFIIGALTRGSAENTDTACHSLCQTVEV